jgi:hypothetical protein
MHCDDLERFFLRKLGQYSRQSPRQHSLARTRRSYHEQVVPTGGRDLERTLGELLPDHIGEVE